MQTMRFLPSFLNFLQKLPMVFIKTQNFCQKLDTLAKKTQAFCQKKLKEIAEKLNGPVVSTTCANRKSAQKKPALITDENNQNCSIREVIRGHLLVILIHHVKI